MGSTNYFNTFIAAAPDSTAVSGIEPPENPQNPSVAASTFRMIAAAPYRHTSDDVIFTVHADRHGIPEPDRTAAREEFFSKGQPCLRSSDLGKRYGWGVHCDGEGRVALFPVGSAEYDRFVGGEAVDIDGTPVTLKYAMRSRRR